jgi:hypothetical protein
VYFVQIKCTYVYFNMNFNATFLKQILIKHILSCFSGISEALQNICVMHTLYVLTFLCYLYKIHLGLNKNKCIFIISVFKKKISLKEQTKKKFTQDTLFSKQYQKGHAWRVNIQYRLFS